MLDDMKDNTNVEDIDSFIDSIDVISDETVVAKSTDTSSVVTYSLKVYYTPQFSAATADIAGFVDHIVQETNLGYLNSGIPLRAKLLCTEIATLNDLDDVDMLLDAFNDMKENVTEVSLLCFKTNHIFTQNLEKKNVKTKSYKIYSFLGNCLIKKLFIKLFEPFTTAALILTFSVQPYINLDLFR